MNWEMAMEMLRRGSKIRRPNWKPNSFWVLSKDGFGRILCHDGTSACVHIKQLEENDWETYDNRTLWNKRIGNPHYYGDAFDIKSVKIFIEDIFKILSRRGHLRPQSEQNTISAIAKEIRELAGERLC